MIEWDDKFITGIERIDSQHRLFHTLLNEFERARKRKASMHRLHRALKELTRYARYHFLSEEIVMKDCGYLGLAEHKKLHAYLMDVLKIKQSEMTLGICDPKQITDFLLEWFAQHVTQEDMKIAEHMRQAKQD